MFPNNEKQLAYTRTGLQDLVELKDRLYCIWQCALNGDPDWIDHDEIIGQEMYRIWCNLYDIIEREHARVLEEQEEMKKFEQGFAYRVPDPTKEKMDL